MACENEKCKCENCTCNPCLCTEDNQCECTKELFKWLKRN